MVYEPRRGNSVNGNGRFQIAGAFIFTSGRVIPVMEHYRDEARDHILAVYNENLIEIGWPE